MRPHKKGQNKYYRKDNGDCGDENYECDGNGDDDGNGDVNCNDDCDSEDDEGMTTYTKATCKCRNLVLLSFLANLETGPYPSLNW